MAVVEYDSAGSQIVFSRGRVTLFSNSWWHWVHICLSYFLQLSLHNTIFSVSITFHFDILYSLLGLDLWHVRFSMLFWQNYFLSGDQFGLIGFGLIALCNTMENLFWNVFFCILDVRWLKPRRLMLVWSSVFSLCRMNLVTVKFDVESWKDRYVSHTRYVPYSL